MRVFIKVQYFTHSLKSRNITQLWGQSHHNCRVGSQWINDLELNSDICNRTILIVSVLGAILNDRSRKFILNPISCFIIISNQESFVLLKIKASKAIRDLIRSWILNVVELESVNAAILNPSDIRYSDGSISIFFFTFSWDYKLGTRAGRVTVGRGWSNLLWHFEVESVAFF